jgi:hypothetical protein
MKITLKKVIHEIWMHIAMSIVFCVFVVGGFGLMGFVIFVIPQWIYNNIF